MFRAALKNEINSVKLANYLQHADIKTTQIYAKVIDKNKRDAVDKLETSTTHKSNIINFRFDIFRNPLSKVSRGISK